MSETVLPLQQVGVLEERRETSRLPPRVLRFGNFELDVTTGELRREGRLIHLRHQPVGVLRLLLERAGDLVTRREITSTLWPDDVDVDVEQGLNHCMKEIRAALGDRTESPRFIQTLPRRGYRFLGIVYEERSGRWPVNRATAPLVTETAPHIPKDPEPDEWVGGGRFE